MNRWQKLRPYHLLMLVDSGIAVSLGFLVGGIAYGVLRLLGAGHRKRQRRDPRKRELCLQPGVVAAFRLHGKDILENFHTQGKEHTCILDPCADADRAIRDFEGISLVSWAEPRLSRLLKTARFSETAILVRELFIIFRMQHWVIREGYEVIRSMQHDYAALRGGIVSLSLAIPHIVEIAGNYELLMRLSGGTCYLTSLARFPVLGGLARRITNALLGFPLRHAFRVLGRNKNNYEHGFALGAPIERLSLVRIRVNPAFFQEAEVPDRPLEAPYLLFVARIVFEKFPHDVLDVFHGLAELHADLHLVMIGDGPLLGEIEKRVRVSPHRARIHLVGPCPNREVFRWTKHAALAFETYSGSALVEKMLCGIPVVAYDVEWMSEVVIDGFTGYLADFRDVADATEKCHRILADPVRARRMGDQSKLLARAMFDRETIEERESRYLQQAFSRQCVL